METIDFKNLEGIVEYGFSDPVTIGQLWKSGFPKDPKLAKPGVYLVFRLEEGIPAFLPRRLGGHYEDQWPSYETEELRGWWIHGPTVLYIGKTGGPGMKATLRKRIRAYMGFGRGRTNNHRGGRAIWQITEAKDLLVLWATADNETPRDVERRLLKEFENTYGRLPFANRQH